MDDLDRALILVTGAPRTATTPVGNALATARRTLALYEPLGTTGLVRIRSRFPMIGEADIPDSAALEDICGRLARLRPGKLHSQQRTATFSLKRAIFGSRTAHSFRLAQAHPWVRTVIWKDPHAVMLVPDLARIGVSVVVTARRPEAHAASYRRLGWVSAAASLYPRWSKRFGPCAVIESALDRAQDPVISAALIWRMSYLAVLRGEALDHVALVTSEDLIADDAGTYARLFDRFGLVPGPKTDARLRSHEATGAAIPASGKTHDWSRSAAAVNAYWKDVLSPEEVADVQRLTEDVATRIF